MIPLRTAAFVVITGTLLAAQDQKPPIFRSSAAAVVVDVSVRDRNRRPITRLDAGDFKLLDNGVLQEVTDVTYGKLPIDVTVALDVSQSVTGDLLKRLRQGVVQLMRDLDDNDRLKLILFNMRIAQATGFTRDVKVVEAAMSATPAGGGTALLDAMSVALVSASTPDRRQLVVFFTDGSDTTSITTARTITAVAQRSRATLTFVVPGASRSMVIPSTNPAVPNVTTMLNRRVVIPLQELLTTLASETGGSMIPVAPGVDLSPTFTRALSEFRSAYVLYYTPRGVERGGYHTIEVKVAKDGATVQARRGYFAP